MSTQDDPEARIRQLEQPLADYAVELGATGSATPTASLPPPAYGAPYPPSPYGAPPFGVSYPQPPKKGAPVGLIFALIAVVVVLIFAGIGALVWTRMSPTTDGLSTRPDVVGGGGSVDKGATSGPTALPTAESAVPEVAVAPAGGQYSVAGVDEFETIDCNGSNVSVSGVNNSVTLLGHCLSLTVSGVENEVTVDSADTIGASGFDNRVIYRSGSPQIDATGSNTVAQG